MSQIISLKNRHFVIKKLEDEYFVFKRKLTTPPYVLIFPEEADRLHDAGYDVFTVDKSLEDENRYVLRVYPNPFKLERKDGFWIRRLGAKTLHIAKSSPSRPYLPEVEPGSTGFFVDYLTGNLEEAQQEALKFVQSIGQPGFIFDFTENYIHVIHKNMAN